MSTEARTEVAIVDYGLGNLYSVKHACAHVGLQAAITLSRQEILQADAVILPGVGAFGDAMATLARLDLVSVLHDFAASGRPLVGVCLGMQLVMTESHEFGRHKGLGLIEGEVVRFENPVEGARALKVPQIGWNSIHQVDRPGPGEGAPWDGTLLEGIPDGEAMYFVHSYIVRPADDGVRLAMSTYGGIRFCSALQKNNIMACQFHPERSGPQGLRMYRNLAGELAKRSGTALTANLQSP